MEIVTGQPECNQTTRNNLIMRARLQRQRSELEHNMPWLRQQLSQEDRLVIKTSHSWRLDRAPMFCPGRRSSSRCYLVSSLEHYKICLTLDCTPDCIFIAMPILEGS